MLKNNDNYLLKRIAACGITSKEIAKVVGKSERSVDKILNNFDESNWFEKIAIKNAVNYLEMKKYLS